MVTNVLAGEETIHGRKHLLSARILRPSTTFLVCFDKYRRCKPSISGWPMFVVGSHQSNLGNHSRMTSSSNTMNNFQADQIHSQRGIRKQGFTA
jgi:hypothetical protein